MNKLHNIFLINIKCFIIRRLRNFDQRTKIRSPCCSSFFLLLPSSFLLQRNLNDFWACQILKDTR